MTDKATTKDKFLTGFLILLFVIFAIEVITIIILKTSPDSAISSTVSNFVNSCSKAKL